MKKLILFLMTMLLAACSAPMPSEDVGSTQEAICTAGPYASGSAGCIPGTTCASPKSVLALKQNTAFPGGTPRQIWAYYGGAWVLAVDFGYAGIDATISGAIGSPTKPPINKLTFTNATYWDGAGTRITAECYNTTTGNNDCVYDEIVVHRLQVYANKTCNYGSLNHHTVGLTRVQGLGGIAYDDGDVSFSGYDKTGSTEAYVSCDPIFINACSSF
jgi:hypothetical protein